MSPRGDERIWQIHVWSETIISTHISTKRRTSSVTFCIYSFIFQLTSPQGDEPDDDCTSLESRIFQFTSPQGDEHKIPLPPQVDRNFNSRLREETNPRFLSYHILFNLFQLTSPQGDEHKAVSLFISLLLFQLTSPRGDEPSGTNNFVLYKTNFKSRLREETNIPSSLLLPVPYISTHVSVRRRTDLIFVVNGITNISTHVSVRRRTLPVFLF